MQTERKELNENIKQVALKTIRDYMQSGAFTDRKVTDTPQESFSVVNREYVTLNGPTSTRPLSSVAGQSYLDMTLASGRGKPVWWNGTGFVDATGSYV